MCFVNVCIVPVLRAEQQVREHCEVFCDREVLLHRVHVVVVTYTIRKHSAHSDLPANRPSFGRHNVFRRLVDSIGCERDNAPRGAHIILYSRTSTTITALCCGISRSFVVGTI
jgi:hypothetical protein